LPVSPGVGRLAGVGPPRTSSRQPRPAPAGGRVTGLATVQIQIW